MLETLRIRYRLREDRTRIGHPRIEPELVEIVAEVGMCRDVAPRSAAVVAPHPVPDPRRQPRETTRPRRAPEREAIAHEQIEQRHRIGARPVARGPALIPADRSRRCQPDQRTPAMKGHDRQRPRRPAAQHPARPVGKPRIDPATLQPRIDPIEQPVKDRRKQARRKGRLLGRRVVESLGRGHRGAPCNSTARQERA